MLFGISEQCQKCGHEFEAHSLTSCDVKLSGLYRCTCTGWFLDLDRGHRPPAPVIKRLKVHK